MKRYVRNKFLVLSLAGGLTAVGVGSILGEVPNQVAGIKSPSDLMALLSGRSPGDRAAGASANKTKRPLIQHKMAERDTPVAPLGGDGGSSCGFGSSSVACSACRRRRCSSGRSRDRASGSR